MAAPRNRPTPKLCARCGAFYRDLASQICPQCFARLDTLTDEQAAAMLAEQESRAHDPEWEAERRSDDERFNEQSFGACLAIVATLAALAVLCVILVVIAARRHPVRAPAPLAATAPQPHVAETPVALPADFDRLVPPMVGADPRTYAGDRLTLPGSGERIYRGVYRDGVQLFAVAGRRIPQAQAAALELAADAAADQHDPPLLVLLVRRPVGEIVIAAPGKAQQTAFAQNLTRRDAP